MNSSHDSESLSPAAVLTELDREGGLFHAALRRPRESVSTTAPTAQLFELPTPGVNPGDDNRVMEVHGEQLGFGTSRSDRHRDHPDSEFMPPGRGRCSACRWFEIRIIRVTDPDDVGGTYVVHTYGGSVVPGEKARCRAFVTSSAYEIVAFLTVHHQGHTYVPNSSLMALAQSAQWDDALRGACFDRRTGIITQLGASGHGERVA